MLTTSYRLRSSPALKCECSHPDRNAAAKLSDRAALLLVQQRQATIMAAR